ncbi:hypothetical protein B0A54_09704 [Friedmanniomyces endolithicus]|uniref:DRBM domain-containing protein n=1 Tax=Friedmanniomyces endolithicus TaxID=329885 RepID=A0A4U0UT26_9PEZI|nr:hypothetical protein B0A54_09704 [Friedmanniomyces endolithicus]
MDELLNSLLVPLNNGSLVRASQLLPTNNGKYRREVDDMAEVGPGGSNSNGNQNMSTSPVPPAQTLEIEGLSRPGNYINVEEHIREASHDEMDLQNIDDWERENLRQEKPRFVPATLQTVKIHTDYTAENHKPVASQDAKYNPEIVAKLQSLCWERGLTASFDIAETSPRLFAASVSFAGQTVNSEGSFPAKRLAEENVCRLAIPIVEHFDPNSTKRKESSDEGMPVDRITDEELNGSNWADGAFGASYVDMAAYFNMLDVQKDSRLAGPIGKVERVFGKKQAKEQCCEKVLSFLKELKPRS